MAGNLALSFLAVSPKKYQKESIRQKQSLCLLQYNSTAKLTLERSLCNAMNHHILLVNTVRNSVGSQWGQMTQHQKQSISFFYGLRSACTLNSVVSELPVFGQQEKQRKAVAVSAQMSHYY